MNRQLLARLVILAVVLSVVVSTVIAAEEESRTSKEESFWDSAKSFFRQALGVIILIGKIAAVVVGVILLAYISQYMALGPKSAQVIVWVLVLTMSLTFIGGWVVNADKVCQDGALYETSFLDAAGLRMSNPVAGDSDITMGTEIYLMVNDVSKAGYVQANYQDVAAATQSNGELPTMSVSMFGAFSGNAISLKSNQNPPIDDSMMGLVVAMPNAGFGSSLAEAMSYEYVSGVFTNDRYGFSGKSSLGCQLGPCDKDIVVLVVKKISGTQTGDDDELYVDGGCYLMDYRISRSVSGDEIGAVSYRFALEDNEVNFISMRVLEENVKNIHELSGPGGIAYLDYERLMSAKRLTSMVYVDDSDFETMDLSSCKKKSEILTKVEGVSEREQEILDFGLVPIDIQSQERTFGVLSTGCDQNDTVINVLGQQLTVKMIIVAMVGVGMLLAVKWLIR